MTAKSGVAAANNSLKVTTGFGGLCLKFVRTAWQVPAKYASAKSAWANAKKRHKGLSGIPVGAPLFMSHPKSKYGHVVIWLGNNKVRSTNSSTNRVATYDLDTWTKKWGYTIQGWTEDLNGVDLPIDPKTPAKPKPKPDPIPGILDEGDRGVRVRHLQEGLNTIFPSYSKLAADGLFGDKTEKVIKEFQKRSGLKVDGIVGPATKAKLAKAGVRF